MGLETTQSLPHHSARTLGRNLIHLPGRGSPLTFRVVAGISAAVSAATLVALKRMRRL